MWQRWKSRAFRDFSSQLPAGNWTGGQSACSNRVGELGEHLASSKSKASEPGLAARQKEQPVAGGATQAGKSEEEKSGQTELAASNRASSQASLDKLTREIVDSVCCTLESFVASQFERDSSCKYSEILELPRGNL